MAEPMVDIPPMEDAVDEPAATAMPPPPPAAAMGNGLPPNNNNEEENNNPPKMPPPNPLENNINNEYEEPQQDSEIKLINNENEIEHSSKPTQDEIKEEKSDLNETKPKQKASKKESQSKGLREPWNATESDTSKNCWAEISKKKGATINWYACKQKTKKSTKLVVVGKGNNGINEIRDYLKGRSTVIRFILLRVNSSDLGNEHSSNRAKFVFFKYYGTKSKRAGLLGKLGKILEKFPVRHLEISADESLDKIDAESLGKQFLRVGGAHKPDQYDFGGGVIWKTK